MTILGLADETVVPLIRALTCATSLRDPRADGAKGETAEEVVGRNAGETTQETTGEEIADRFARAAWNHLIEPGDRTAGAALRLLGPVESLELLLTRPSGERFAAALSERDGTGEVSDAGEAGAALDRWLPRLSADEVLRGLRQALRIGAALLTPDDPAWPTGLADLGDYGPPALWARGDLSRLGTLVRSIAIVGARATTGYGEHVAVDLAAGLADERVAVVSGAAYGIDGAAHRAALASEGTTVAILAGGLDRFYPSGHAELLARIVDFGVVLSEAPCGRAPTKWRFLQRNRLIAAATRATVVVEAGWRSGSLNTARHALQLGRPVGAVPGPVTSAASAGCHRLLRDYPVMCVTSAAEAAELIGDEPHDDRAQGGFVDPDRTAPADPEGVRQRLLDALSPRQQRDAERLAAISGLAFERVRSELGLLELEGTVRRGDRGWRKSSS